MNRVGRGAIAGLVATVPMTAVFVAGRAAGLLRTPPPVQITDTAEARAGVRDDLNQPAFGASWAAAHLAYGAGCGAIFAAARPALPRSSTAAGLLFGLTVWSVSYGVAMPALGLYPSLRRDRPTRVGVTAVAHAVFGLALAAVAGRSVLPDRR